MNKSYFDVNRRVRTQADPHHGVKYEVDHPYLYVIINTMDENDHVVMIEQYPGVFQAVDEVVRVLEHSLGLLTCEKGWKLDLIPHETNKVQDLGMMAVCSAIERRLGKERTIENLYGHEEAQRRIYLGKTENIVATSPPASPSQKEKKFVSALYDKKKLEKVKALINELMEGATETHDIIMPFRAAIEAGVMRRATWAEIKESFDLDEKYRSSYYRLTSESNTTYNGHAFDVIVARFRAL